MDILSALFRRKRSNLSIEDVAKMLEMNPDKLRELEAAYREFVSNSSGDGLFDTSAKQVAAEMKDRPTDVIPDEICARIADELVSITNGNLLPGQVVKPDELVAFPVGVRPQLTGTAMKVDMANQDEMPGMVAMEHFLRWTQTGNVVFYNQFRQGLDILDLDPVIYEILGRNRNSMGFWFQALKQATDTEGFFRIPETKIVKVPMPILQMSRLDYGSLTPSTLKIVDDWAFRAFDLDVTKTYFVKTGTFSSKFDFRNAKVSGEKEVRELGEYLLFIQHQAVLMAGPLSVPSIYGVSTTNEWVVREFIEDVEGNPCIYKGLPLRTEYRVFIDCDEDEVLGVCPYWHPETMEKRFRNGAQSGDVHMRHDYAVFKAHEPVLMSRYNNNVEKVVSHICALLPDLSLNGQWALDVMQNGSCFWLIDMSLADQSALSFCVPKGKLKPQSKTGGLMIPSP